MAKVIWLTGISGSGKTTLGTRLKKRLERLCRVEFLDGDVVRNFFDGDLGYSREERIFNVKRIAFAAMLLARNGVNVIVANIAPYFEVRDFIRKNVRDYVQIYLKASLKKVRERDVKGLYQSHKNGEIEDLVGMDDVYDVPRNPDLVVDTDNETVEGSLSKILSFLAKEGLANEETVEA